MQPKPQRINIRTENIPQELVGKPRWVGWKWVWREGENGKPGKWTKPPYDVKTGKIASSTDPSTWESFDKAYQAYKTNGYDGIGFVLNGEYTGFDFDDSRDPSNGQISEPSLSEIVRLNSYTEMSPGMEGLKTLVRAKLPKGGHHGERMGVFDIGRYFCITGHVIEGVSKRIESRQSEVDYFLKRFYPGDFGENGNGQPRTEGSGPSPKIPSDVDLIQKATKAANGAKFKKLWDGDHGDYPSQSEADFALCLILSFWTGRNAARIDSLFRQSGLMREKWDEKHYGDGRTYGQATIQKAIEETTEVYSQSQNSERTGGPSYTTSLLHYHLTDAGNAECFRELFGGQHIFIPEKKKWLRFDGIKWSEDQQVLLKMLETVRLRGKQAMSVLEDPEARKAAVKWSLASESRMRLNAALSVAEPMLSQGINSFDSNPWVLCCSNGAIDLKTGRLITPTKEDWLYKSTNVPYDPEARCGRFSQFLEEVFNGDRQIMDFVQKAMGYSLTGLTVEQVLFILYGTGANGKSIFLNLMGDLLGDYSITTPASTFKDTPYHDSIPNDIARMAGARFIKSIEVKEGTKLNEERIKALTGGDRITARFLHNEFFEFIPVGKFWIAANHKPVVRGSDEAIWRRIRLIPFEVFIPPEKRDPHLSEKLRSELPGILAWAVDGCLKWQEEGLKPVGKVKEWTDNYRAESDLIAQFLEEKTEKAVTGKIKAGDLYKTYEAWCKERGEFAITGTKFGKRMEEKGFFKKKEGYVYYHGLELV